jgi:serpin B
MSSYSRRPGYTSGKNPVYLHDVFPQLHNLTQDNGVKPNVFNQLNLNNITSHSQKDESKTSHKVREGETKLFAFDLLLRLNSDTDQTNMVYSPLSIYSALRLVSEGAKGTTKKEIEDAIQVNTISDNVIHCMLQNSSESKLEKIIMCNNLWISKSLEINPEFHQAIQKYHPTLSVFSSSNLPELVSNLNNYVNKMSNHTINKVVSESDFDPNTSLVLTNIIYFKGKWSSPFTKIKKESFYLMNSQIVRTDMMSIKDNFKYAKLNKFRVIELPYQDFTSKEKSNNSNSFPLNAFNLINTSLKDNTSEYSMVFVLPHENSANSLRETLEDVSYDMSFFDKMKLQKVDLKVPKFKVEYEFEAKHVLQSMGINQAFNDKCADFSLIPTSSKVQLKIDKIIHKAVVEVDETGTVASAATVATMHFKSKPLFEDEEFITNRPFIFMIVERSASKPTIIFAGILKTPSDPLTSVQGAESDSLRRHQITQVDDFNLYEISNYMSYAPFN